MYDHYVCGYSMVLGHTNEYNKLRGTSVYSVNKPIFMTIHTGNFGAN